MGIAEYVRCLKQSSLLCMIRYESRKYGLDEAAPKEAQALYSLLQSDGATLEQITLKAEDLLKEMISTSISKYNARVIYSALFRWMNKKALAVIGKGNDGVHIHLDQPKTLLSQKLDALDDVFNGEVGRRGLHSGNHTRDLGVLANSGIPIHPNTMMALISFVQASEPRLSGDAENPATTANDPIFDLVYELHSKALQAVQERKAAVYASRPKGKT
jgi:hypothetical protein